MNLSLSYETLRTPGTPAAPLRRSFPFHPQGLLCIVEYIHNLFMYYPDSCKSQQRGDPQRVTRNFSAQNGRDAIIKGRTAITAGGFNWENCNKRGVLQLAGDRSAALRRPSPFTFTLRTPYVLSNIYITCLCIIRFLKSVCNSLALRALQTRLLSEMGEVQLLKGEMQLLPVPSAGRNTIIREIYNY